MVEMKTTESALFEETGSTSQQTGPSNQQLEVQLIRCQVDSWAGEDGVRTLLLRVHDPILFSWGGTKTTGRPTKTRKKGAQWEVF